MGQKTDQVYLDRYAALLNLAQTIPSDERFNLGYWIMRAPTECGTAACLAGHAALHPFFVNQGFTKFSGHHDSHNRTCSVSYAPQNEAEDKELAQLRYCDALRGCNPEMAELALYWGMSGRQLVEGDSEEYDFSTEELNEPQHPFWPSSYEHAEDPRDPTAEEAADYLREWMHFWWSDVRIREACRRLSYVQYDANFVHHYTDWRPSVDPQIEQDWKEAVVGNRTALGLEDYAKAVNAVAWFNKLYGKDTLRRLA